VNRSKRGDISLTLTMACCRWHCHSWRRCSCVCVWKSKKSLGFFFFYFEEEKIEVWFIINIDLGEKFVTLFTEEFIDEQIRR